MWSCMPGGLREIVLSFKFCQNRLNDFRDVEGRNSSFPVPLASGLLLQLVCYTTVQAAVIDIINIIFLCIISNVQ